MKVILALDDISKEKIKSNISVLISRGVFIVSSLNEITDLMLSETRTVFILEGMFQQRDGIAALRVYKACLNLEYIFLMPKSKWDDLISGMGRLYATDIVNLSFDVIQAALFDDKALEAVDIESDIDCCELAKKNCEDDSCGYTERLLSNTLLSVLAREAEARRKLDALTLRCEQLNCECEILRNKNNNYMQEYTKMFSKAVQLNEALSQYEVIFTKDIYTKIDLYSHSERPSILYIKEFEELVGFDRLIETLYNAIRIQSRQSVKVLRLYDSSSSRKILTLPSYYTVIKNKYKMTDIECNDFVCKTGDYVRILDSLLLNRMHLDVLIVADCKDHNDTVLSGSYIIFNTCRRKSSLAPLKLSEKNTITNDNTDLHWEEYDTSSMDKKESFVILSNQPVIGVILQAIKRFEGA